MPRRARRQHAIHHVDAQRDVIGDLLGLSHAHQVARTILRQQRGHFASHFASERMRLADRQSADSVPRKIQLEKLPRTLASQIAQTSRLARFRIATAPVRRRGSPAFQKILSRAPRPLVVRFTAASALSRGAGVSMHSSSTIAMSDPSAN